MDNSLLNHEHIYEQVSPRNPNYFIIALRNTEERRDGDGHKLLKLTSAHPY